MDKVNEFKQAFFLLPYTVKFFPNLTSGEKKYFMLTDYLQHNN